MEPLTGFPHIFQGLLQRIPQLTPLRFQGLTALVAVLQTGAAAGEVGPHLGDGPIQVRDASPQGLALRLQPTARVAHLFLGLGQGHNLPIQLRNQGLQGLKRLAASQNAAEGMVLGRGAQPVGTDLNTLRGDQGLTRQEPGALRQGL